MNADEKAVAEPMCPHCGSTKLFSKIGRMGGVGGWDAMWIACHGCSAFGPAVRFDGSPLLGERSLFGADHCPSEAESITAFTQPAHALRAALARAERAETLVREAGVMLKQREFDRGDGVTIWCGDCGTEARPHLSICPYAALLARIAELEKP